MSMLKIKKGDTVKVIAGSQKDKEGKVIAVNQKDGKVGRRQYADKAHKAKRCEPEWRYYPSGRPNQHFQRNVCTQGQADESRH